MKIRITGKGLPKAQYQNSQVSQLTPPKFNFNYNKLPSELISNNAGITLNMPNVAGYTPIGNPADIYGRVPVAKKIQIGAPVNASDFSSLEEWQQAGSPKLSPKSFTPFTNKLYTNKDESDEKQKIPWFKVGVGLASALTDVIQDRRRQNRFDKMMREQGLSDNLFAYQMTPNRGDYVQTGSRLGEFRPNQYVVNKGMYANQIAQMGGDLDSDAIYGMYFPPMHIAAYGGQSASAMGLSLSSRRSKVDMPKSKSESFKQSISAVPREYANLEAEGGETVYGDLDSDGGNEHLVISGPRHTQGGVPLSLPEGSFIFSDTAKMRIKDPEILKYFSLPPKKGGYTPAEIAKRYDINKYKAIIEDKNQDELNKTSAQLMVKKYEEKLKNLAMIQESMKGFPQGLPKVAADNQQVQDEFQDPQSVQEPDMQAEEIEEAEYGGFLPEYQKGNTVKDPPTSRVSVWDDDEKKIIQDHIKQKYIVEIPINARDTDPQSQRFTLPTIQRSRNGVRIYGDEDWMSSENFADFKRRHKKFFIENPDWDPRRIGDTREFQEWYDAERAKKGMKPYFGKGKSFQGYDDKFGEYTFSAPDLEPGAPVIKQEDPVYYCTENGVLEVKPGQGIENLKVVTGPHKTKEDAQAACKKDTIPPGDYTYKNIPPPFGYMLPDMVNLAATASVRPKKYLPYRASAQFTPFSPTFYDPNRALAANAEQANIQSSYLATMGPLQSYLANSSLVQGKASQNAADTLADFQNRNVGIANESARINSDIQNKQMLFNAQRMNELYDGNVIANQQFDNARRVYNRDLAKSFAQAWNNRMNLGLLNALNQTYRVDPITGRSYFIRGNNPDRLGSFSGKGAGNTYDAIAADFMNAQSKIPGLTFNDYLRISRTSQSMTDKNNDGIIDAASYRSFG